MNKSKLKNYAPAARKSFLRIIRERADLLGLSKREIPASSVQGDYAIIEGNPYPKRFAEMHRKMAETVKNEGLGQVVERIAYSWFNRFAAIRFMEVNGFLSHPYRVFSNPDETKTEPEILEHAADVQLEGLDKDQVIKLKLAGNKDAELYKILLIAQCNELHRAMPFLFERINDESELLLPDNLLHTDSVIRKMVNEIPEEDWHNVEIIGWLYQFYISEKKDEVIGKTVKSEDIPAATQLFTPNWIVKYMTQNSLGRLWLENNPHSQLAQNMEFYIAGSAGILPAASATTDEGSTANESFRADALNAGKMPALPVNPEELRILDPACGSGHILVEAYDLLKAIYLERGYSSRDIPLLILEKNLFGLDIDKRAVQLASFALLMKARNDDRRIFEKINEQQIPNPKSQIPNIHEIPDSSELEYEPAGIAEMFFSDAENRGAIPIRDSNYLFAEMDTQPSLVQSSGFGVQSSKTEDQRPKTEVQITEQNIIDLIELFENGKTYGSLIRIPHGFERVVEAIARLTQTKAAAGNMNEQIAVKLIKPFVQAARILGKRYDAVIANPPYMGGKGMNAELKEFAKREFPESKSDLFAMFIERGFELAKKEGFNAMVTMQSWMFLSSYEKLRERILDERTIECMVHMADMVMGIAFRTCATIWRNYYIPNYKGEFSYVAYENLNKHNKPYEFPIRNKKLKKTSNEAFKKIPGSPIAYWIKDDIFNHFSKCLIKDHAKLKTGIIAGNNNKFIRNWYEISFQNIEMNAENEEDALNSQLTWYPLFKGGERRKWYGNRNEVINFYLGGRNLKSVKNSMLRNTSFYFKEGIHWNRLSQQNFGARISNKSFIFEDLSPSCFPNNKKNTEILLSYLNSNVFSLFLSVLSTGWKTEIGQVSLTPSPLNTKIQDSIKYNTVELIYLSKNDWDSFETSWDFSRFPMLDFEFWSEEKGEKPASVEEAYNLWEELTEQRIERMQELETENNRLFIEAYGLEDELSPEVPLEQITLMRADREDDTKRLLSYFVGCGMGRYSLDKPGLVYADAGNIGFDASNYQTFPADEDGIIPVTDMEWFPQEAALRFADFINVAFENDLTAKDTKDAKEENENKTFASSASFAVKNLSWIAEGLGKRANETPIEAIRRYFSKDFFKDHVQMYKKRPIYWLFSSGKEKAFECLVYLHRYNEQTLARMRQEYVLPLMSKIEARIETLAGRGNEFGERSGGLIETAESTSEKNKLTKELETYKKKQLELKQFDEKLRHYSDLKITLDLDDGVKENYAKFGDLLTMSKQISPKKKKK